MPDDEHKFSSTPLPEPEDSEPVIKKKIIRKKRAPAKTARKTGVKESSKEKEISKQLASIYRDDKGRLPDMKEIDMRKGHPFLRALFILLLIGGLLAGAAWAGFFLLAGGHKFSDEEILLSVSGPSSVTAGATTTYTVAYKNDQSVALRGATVNIQYPEGFVFVSSEPAAKNAGHTEWELGDVPPYRQGQITVTGIMSGSLGQKQSWRVLFGYQPENVNSKLQKTSIFDVAIGSSPFSLTVTGPDKTMIGNAAEYSFKIKKETDNRISKLELKPAVPANFFITSSSPALNKDGVWALDLSKNTPTSTATSAVWTFRLAGRFSSSSEASAVLQADLLAAANGAKYSLAQSSVTTGLLQNNLDFSLAINGSMDNFGVQPGDTLNITVFLKNLNKDAVKNASLKLTLDAPSANKQSVLNWADITDDLDGDIKGTQVNSSVRRGEIVWNKNKLPALASLAQNEETSIDIRLPVKDADTFPLSDLAAYQINALADVTFTDAGGVSHTFSSNPIAITLNSDLKFETRDTVSEDGTAHDINWVLTNNFHPLKNIVLTADVYGDVSWDTASPTPAGQVIYDAKIKKIIWTVAEMPEGVDVLALPFTLTLNKINPTQDMLVSKVHVTADDAVSGGKFDFLGDEIPLNQ